MHKMFLNVPKQNIETSPFVLQALSRGQIMAFEYNDLENSVKTFEVSNVITKMILRVIFIFVQSNV